MSTGGRVKKTPAVNTYDLVRSAMFGDVVIVMFRHYEASLRRTISETDTPCFITCRAFCDFRKVIVILPLPMKRLRVRLFG